MLKIDCAALTDPGDRPVNEDSMDTCMNSALSLHGFVVADGLGAYGHGEVASKLTTACFNQAVENAAALEDDLLASFFEEAQHSLLTERDRLGYPNIMTTAVALLLASDGARWGHIGDSRLYRFRRNPMTGAYRLFSRTKDHSVPQMLVEAKKIKSKDISHHPTRNRVLRAIGAEWDSGSPYEICDRAVSVKKGDVFLLCSDGFWEWIDDKAICKALHRFVSASDALRQMQQQVVKNGAGHNMDNYSAILIRLGWEREQCSK